jgi:hypothetical protein
MEACEVPCVLQCERGWELMNVDVCLATNSQTFPWRWLHCVEPLRKGKFHLTEHGGLIGPCLLPLLCHPPQQ